MLSELALVDWIALLIALVLLAVAGIAAYLSHTGSGTSLSHAGPSSPVHQPDAKPTRSAPVPDTPAAARYSPSHALSSGLEENVEATKPYPPLPAHAAPAATTEPQHAADDNSQTADSPPAVVTRSSAPDEVIDMAPDEVIDMTDNRPTSDKFSLREAELVHGDDGESVADRAARLSARPVSESEATLPVAEEEPSEIIFANGSNKLSVGMERAEGFAKRAPGFFSDPIGRHELRYWNGRSWTEYVKEGADRFIDPM